MSHEISTAVQVAIECIVFAILILLIYFFTMYTREARFTKEMQDITMTDITEYREIFAFATGNQMTVEEVQAISPEYPYDALDKHTIATRGAVVTGDDIVRLMGLYPNEYNIVIRLNSGKERKIDRIDERDKWNTSLISDWLSGSIMSQFYMLPIYDDLYGRYETMMFVEV